MIEDSSTFLIDNDDEILYELNSAWAPNLRSGDEKQKVSISGKSILIDEPNRWKIKSRSVVYGDSLQSAHIK